MLSDYCDAVVMLTGSDWRTEMRGNRYHYAKRFAEHLPVLFVQPDLRPGPHEPRKTALPNVTVLHVPRDYTPQQATAIRRGLAERGVHNPILWIYNHLFSDFILSTWAPVKVYHATEDPFLGDAPPAVDVERLLTVLAGCDLLVSVSEGVQEDYLRQGRFRGESLVVTNGCDFEQWAGCADSAERGKHGKIALYQGGINRRIDLEMVRQAARSMPDWLFWFCGEVALEPGRGLQAWKTLCSLENVKYLGKLPPDKLTDCMSRATVGLIPFAHGDAAVERSCPGKAFEYLACGLPVVTVAIPALQAYADLFVPVAAPEDLAPAIRRAASEYATPEKIQAGLAAAKEQDYGPKVRRVVEKIEECITTVQTTALRHNILVLYDDRSTHVNTLKEHLESFGTYSCHHVHYAPATGTARCEMDLSLFDVLVVHYSIRVNLPSYHTSASYTEAIREFKGLKVLFIQDEYDTTGTAWQWIRDMGVHVVYTCVPHDYVRVAYPPEQLPRVELVENLTGCVPIEMEHRTRTKPMDQRTYVLGYRGRRLPYWYGKLGREKLMIGVDMRRICDERGIRCNIEWEHEHRIYGPAWYDFIEDCRAVLGTESGANIFDFDGTLSRDVSRALEEEPDMTFEEAFERFLRDHEGNVVMNQVSPKVFEAVALRTALVLFEGGYSGVVRPEEHFIPLKKDYSNVDDVLARLEDIDYLHELTARAYRDIIESGRYSYRAFIRDFDDMLARKLRRGAASRLISTLISARGPTGEMRTFFHRQPPGALPTDVVLPMPLEEFQARLRPPEIPTEMPPRGTGLPPCVRWPINLLFGPLVRFGRAVIESVKPTEPHVVTPLQAKILHGKLRMSRRSIVLKQLSRIEPAGLAGPGALNARGPFLKISARAGKVRMEAVACLGGPGLRVRSDRSPAESDLHSIHPPDGLRLTQWRDLGRQSWRYELDDGVCVLWDEVPAGHAEVRVDLLSILLGDRFQIHPLEAGFVFASEDYTLRGDVALSRDARLTVESQRLVGWRCVPGRLRRDPNLFTLSLPPTGSTWDLQAVTVLQAGCEEPPEAAVEILEHPATPWGARLDVGDRRYLLLGPDLPGRREYPGCERVPAGGRPVAVRYDGDEIDVIWAVTDEGLMRFA